LEEVQLIGGNYGWVHGGLQALMAVRHFFSRSTVEDPVVLRGRLSWLRLLAFPLVIGVPHFVSGVALDSQWLLLSGLASMLFLLAGRLPIVAAVGQVLVLAWVVGLDDVDALPFKVMASVAVFEAALTSPLRRAVVPGALLAAVTVWIMVLHQESRGELPYKVVFVAVAPMLLGAYLHAQHRAARARHTAAVAAESRRRHLEREATYRERAAIARELHDVVAHHVASIALRSAIARDVLPDLDPAARAVFDDIHGAAALTLNEMRRLVMLLRVPVGGPATGPVAVEMLDPAELVPELSRLVDGVRDLGLPVELQLNGDLGQIDAGQALTMLRIAQEGLTNVLRHAGPGALATVRIDLADSELAMAVADREGAGSTSVGGRRGFGLVGLRERVELLGGLINAGPVGDGWEVSVTFRLDRSPDSSEETTGPPLPAPPEAASITPAPSAAADRPDASTQAGLVRRQ